MAELVACVHIGNLGRDGPSGNIHVLISTIGITDSAIGIARIFIEGTAALLGPVNHKGHALRARFKFLPETKWKEVLNG